MSGTDIKEIIKKNKSKIKWIGAKHQKVTEIKHLLKGKARDSERRFVIEGIWSHQKMLAANIEVQSVFFCPECIFSHEAVLMAEKFMDNCTAVYGLSKKTFEKLSVNDRERPDGFLSIGVLPHHKKEDLALGNEAVILILDGLENPGNIGTILRTCDGAGVDAVFVCNKRGRLTNPKLIKGSMGAVFTIPIIEFETIESCLSWLKTHGFRIFLADPHATTTFKDYHFQGKLALVMGNERYGFSENWYEQGTQPLTIPMQGICDSLNVGIAASVIIYEMCMSR